jgi:transcription termination/antitermination protein NusG
LKCPIFQRFLPEATSILCDRGGRSHEKLIVLINWKAIHVASRAEKKVAERLEEKGFTYYLPIQKVMRQWSDRKKMITQPMVRGYVFVQPQPNERVPILEIPGVVCFVRNLGHDAIIREKEIQTLRAIESLGYETTLCKTTIHAGEHVKIEHGPLKGHDAKVIEVNKDGTIYAFLLEGIGQCVKVKIPSEIVSLTV